MCELQRIQEVMRRRANILIAIFTERIMPARDRFKVNEKKGTSETELHIYNNTDTGILKRKLT